MYISINFSARYFILEIISSSEKKQALAYIEFIRAQNRVFKNSKEEFIRRINMSTDNEFETFEKGLKK